MIPYYRILTILFMLFLAACGGNKEEATLLPSTVVEHVNQYNQVYKRESTMDSASWADAEISKNNADCWIGVTQNNAMPALPEGATTEQTLAMILGGAVKEMSSALANQNNPVQPCELATNSNDVKVTQEEGKTQRSVARSQATEGIVGEVIGGTLVYKGISEAGKLASSFINGMGTTNNISATEGSTVQGAIGEGNSYTDSSGVQVDPITVAPVALGTVTEESSDTESDVTGFAAVTDAASCLAGGFEVRDGDGSEEEGTGSGCSDRSGTFTPFS